MTQINDIIPPGSGTPKKTKRSIRDVPLPEKKQNKIDELLKETAEFRSEHQHHAPTTPPQPPTHITMSRNTSNKRTHFWPVTLGVLVLVALGALFLFRGAKVEIALKTENIPVDFVATATSDATLATSSLTYKVLPVQKEESKEVSATGASTKVEKKASGIIIIYNNYNSSSQALIVPTRFETPEGLVFRIAEPVTVPGTTIANGQVVPGSVEAVVYADQTGPSYNIEKTDFTIPGFKGTPKYDGFYARSKTAMTGGFSGNVPQVSAADQKAADDELKASLTSQAMIELKNSLPADSVMFEGGIRTTYVSDVSSGANGKAVVKGTLKAEAIIFDQAEIENRIAENRNGQHYHFDNLESLTLSIDNQKPVTSFISGPVLSLTFKGTLTTGQSFDEDALKRALSDKSKGQLQEILKMYPEIIKAEATIRPFWNKNFPKDPEKIDIVVTKE